MTIGTHGLIVVLSFYLAVISAAEESPEALLGRYLQQGGKSFVIDPQNLLSAEKREQQEAFLAYHASDSQIDVRVMLLASGQGLPAGVNAEFLIDNYFDQSREMCLGVYFYGEPERSEIAYSRGLRRSAGSGAAADTVSNLLVEVRSLPDPKRQFEEFCKQLSMRIYWLEEDVGLLQDATPIALSPTLKEPVFDDQVGSVFHKVTRSKPFVITASLFIVGAFAVLGWWLRRRSVKFRFPDQIVEERLGGPFGAGIGAVVHFGSTTESPTLQRDRVPDLFDEI